MSINFQSALQYNSLQIAYKITMFAMWGLGVDLPRLLVRYARSYPMVINIHNISMMIIGLLTLMYVTSITVIFYTQNYKAGAQLVGLDLAQFVLAWLLCGCIIVQFGIGFKVRYQLVTDKINGQLFTLKRVHRYLGMLMSVLGKIVVALQIKQVSSDGDILFKIWLFVIGALVIVFIFLQILYRIETRSVMLKFPLKNQSKYQRYLQQILSNINSNVDQFPDYKELGVRYLILNNKMYYIDENFIHPGGEHIFTMYNGQQINYLFKGTHQISPQLPRHNHTKYAVNYLQQRYIGQIQVEPLLLNYNSNSEDIVDWKLSAIEQMEGDSNLVEFQADGAYVRQKFNVENFGKYVMISCSSQEIIRKVSRPYSLLVSWCYEQQRTLERFKQAYKYYYMESSTSSFQNVKKQQSLFDGNQGKSALTFCIKKYQNGVFTKFMFSSQTQRRFQVSGPYGRGLRLKPTSKGFFIMIAAGTGILPFIDLFNYLLRKILLKLITEKAGPDVARKLNQQRDQYDYLEDVRILFIGSFQSSKHFYLNQAIRDLRHLSLKHKLNVFDMKIRYNNSSQVQPDVEMINQMFDKKFIEDLIKINPDRIYYCGPSSIEQTVRKAETENTNSKTKFFYL